jgi:hypothetical protein
VLGSFSFYLFAGIYGLSLGWAMVLGLNQGLGR